jgi:hypothetical protein
MYGYLNTHESEIESGIREKNLKGRCNNTIPYQIICTIRKKYQMEARGMGAWGKEAGKQKNRYLGTSMLRLCYVILYYTFVGLEIRFVRLRCIVNI